MQYNYYEIWENSNKENPFKNTEKHTDLWQLNMIDWFAKTIKPAFFWNFLSLDIQQKTPWSLDTILQHTVHLQ